MGWAREGDSAVEVHTILVGYLFKFSFICLSFIYVGTTRGYLAAPSFFFLFFFVIVLLYSDSDGVTALDGLESYKCKWRNWIGKRNGCTTWKGCRLAGGNGLNWPSLLGTLLISMGETTGRAGNPVKQGRLSELCKMTIITFNAGFSMRMRIYVFCCPAWAQANGSRNWWSIILILVPRGQRSIKLRV